MGLEIRKGFFKGKKEALEDIVATGFWPTTFISPPSPALDLHWHDSDIHGYVVEGSTWILDGETGKRLDIEAGDKLIIPYGAMHAEGGDDRHGRLHHLTAQTAPALRDPR